ncbi:LysM peptidoglycan-binding domain-containing protein [Virgibacillus sp. NKC19-16]|uniref:C40 family peptidase n=1 Tax=Virgibacillus salidurans TaxID=2831673 RepID=UPI001F37E705|nr:peptidoglycan endopeptidase [Virgibacillus sp. NKC19-16]UJL45828.1 LysM peptidoglycan-binding domain-containing protein [Virgibacillus sp. NKC19-16]
MANKKILMSVTASAAIASAIFAAEEAEAASHKVQSGDSLWAIAQQYSTSVSQLKSINNLSGDLIFPNQVIETSTQSSSSNSNNNSSSNSSTYTVKRGDTLSGIASEHNVSISDLMDWNNLDTTLIYPGNVFTVTSGGSSGSSSGSSSGGSSSGDSGSSSGGSSSGSSVYTVKSGDTLSEIAVQHGVSVSNLRDWNNLSSSLIVIGQQLSINGSSSGSSGSSGSSSGSDSSNGGGSSAPSDVDYNVDQLINAAKAQMGTPYVWGGSTTSGFDCSGFIYYAYKQAGMDISRTNTQGYYDRSYDVSNPQVGDLVFFEGTYKAGISHMGIYLGDGDFIHAGSSTGVTISNVNDPYYWSKHFEGYKRFY